MNDTGIRHAHWTTEPTPVSHPDAALLLRAYFTEIVGRYWRRTATDGEIDAAMAAEPSDGLAPPNGVFLLARYDGVPAGCVGVRLLAERTGEIKRMFVAPRRRGMGDGGRLLAAAERAASDMGAAVVRLDTRRDLIQARRLYARHGYRETMRYNDNPHADHWFEKHILARGPHDDTTEPVSDGTR
ncbi:MAG: GNAT family N-acetyltransferase [Sciscionella sp.]